MKRTKNKKKLELGRTTLTRLKDLRDKELQQAVGGTDDYYAADYWGSLWRCGSCY